MTVALTGLLLRLQGVLCDTYSVVSLSTLIRHGARTPHATNMLNQTWFEEQGYGVLTGNGERQLYNLGQRFQQVYSQLLYPAAYTNFDLIVNASPSLRTVRAAAAFLIGVYSPPAIGPFTSNLDPTLLSPAFAPITYVYGNRTALPMGYGVFDVNTQSKILDFLFRVEDACPNLKEMKATARLSDDKYYDAVPKRTYSALEGLGLTSMAACAAAEWNLNCTLNAFDEMTSYLYQFDQYFPGTDANMYNDLWIAASIDLMLNFNSDQILRIWTDKIGRLMLAEMGNVIAGSSKAKLSLYSAHDWNLTPFMMKLNLTSRQCLEQLYETGASETQCELYPSYAASFNFELATRNSDQSYFVRINYNGNPVTFCLDTVDDGWCAFADFKSRFEEQFLTSEFTEECGSLYFRQSYLRNSVWAYLFGACLVLTGLCCILIQALIRVKGLRSHKLLKQPVKDKLITA